MPIASISVKLSRFPTPKNKSSENKVREIEAISPRRELAKSRENVKRRVIKTNVNSKGIAPKVFGSTKYINNPVNTQKRMVKSRVGRKFFRFRTCSFLLFFLIYLSLLFQCRID